MEQTLSACAARFGKLADHLTGSNLRQVTTRVAVKAKEDFAEEVRSDLGADMAFSGWRNRPKITSGFDVISDHEAELKPRPQGIVKVAEYGRSGGSVIPKRAKRKIVMTPAGPRTVTRDHPIHVGATAGHKTWTHAVERIAKATPDRVGAEVRRLLTEVFR